MLDIYREIASILSEGKEAALVTIISASHSTPRGVGAKMLVMTDGSTMGTVGGGRSESELIKDALDVIKTGKSRIRHFCLVPREGVDSAMVCGGEFDAFIEHIRQSPVLYIFGAGHVSLALAPIAKMIGFRVIVIDDRDEYANKDRFPQAESVVVSDFDNVVEGLKIDRNSYIVIVTRGHITDEKILEQSLKTPARYIGMIGSKTKMKTLSAHLISMGVSSELLEKVHTPIGIEINAELPEEIAISIIAEIIKVHRSVQ